jgi:hypothetical protein
MQAKGQDPGLFAIVADAKRKRRANKKVTPAPAGIAFQFTAQEYAILKFNHPGASGVIGGYQKMENIVVETTNKTTLVVVLNAIHYERLTRYIKSYGDGGPNKRLRKACVPALRRIGIDLLPGWVA